MSRTGLATGLADSGTWRGILSGLTAAFMALSLAAPAQAQVTADPNAPAQNRPGVGTAPNGASTVDIAKPNQAGVSHNIYTDFNVGAPGLVLNNSLAGGNSQLAGALLGNPNLQGASPAFLILNEVSGANRSLLAGSIEVFGQSADFVLANPNGITCRGCGFINTPRATLTTGKPVLDAVTGALVGFDVDRGDIAIEQATVGGSRFGADVTGVQYFDVIARSIMVAGLIKGDESRTEIGLFAGRNTFDYNARSVTAKADDGSSKPEFGIDSTLLGGAYAHRITLIGTENGVGVRTPAEVRAAYGGMDITADGKLVFGKTQAKGAIRAQSKSSTIEVAKDVWSETALNLTAAGKITVLESVTAGAKGNVALKSESLDLNSGALLGAGLDETGQLAAGGLLAIEAANLTNRGTLRASQDIEISVTGTTVNSGQMLSGETLALLGGGLLRNEATGLMSGDQGLILDVAQAFNAGRIFSAGGTVTANVAGNAENSGSIEGREVALTAGGLLANQAGGTINSQTRTGVAAAALTNDGSLASQGQLVANATGDLRNSGSIAGQDVALNAGGLLANQTGGTINSQTRTGVAAATLTNEGSLASQGQLVANVAGDLTNRGGISAGQSADIRAGGVLSNDLGAEITAGATLTLQAATLLNIGAIDESVIDGLISARDLVIGGNLVQNAGTLTALNDLSITATDSVENVLGRIEAGNRLTIVATQLFRNLSGVVRGKDVSITAAKIENITLVERDDELIIPEEYEGLVKTDVVAKIDTAVKDYRTAITAKFQLIEEKILYTLREQLGEAKLSDELKDKIRSILQQNSNAQTPGTSAAITDQITEAVRTALYRNAKPDQIARELPTLLGGLFRRSQDSATTETALFEVLRSTFARDPKLASVEAALRNLLQTASADNGAAGTAEASIFAAVRDGLAATEGSSTAKAATFLKGTISNRTAGSGNYTETAAAVAEISAGGHLTLSAAQTITDIGGRIAAQGNLELKAGQSVDMTALRLTSVQNKSIKGGHDNLTTVMHRKSELAAGGDITVTAGDDIRLKGVDVTSGGDTSLAAKGEVDLAGVKDETHKDYYKKKKSGILNHKKTITVDKLDETRTVQTSIASGGMVDVLAEGGDVTVTATAVKAEADIRLKSGIGNVVLKGDRNVVISEKYKKKSSLFGLNSSSTKTNHFSDLNEPSFISGKGDVILDSAAGDLIVNGSVVQAGGDIRVTAQTVELQAAENIIRHEEVHKQSGLFADAFAGNGSAGFSFGYKSETHTLATEERLAQVSALIANGSIVIEAARDLTSQGAQLIAGNDLIVNAGRNIAFDSAYDVASRSETHKSKQIGITASVGENVSSAVRTIASAPEDFNSGEGSDAFKAITQVSTALRTIDAVSGLVYGPLVSANLSLGVSSSNSKMSQDGSYAHVGLMQAGRDVALNAGGDLGIEGTQIEAARYILAAAAGDLVIQSALSQTQERSSSRQRNASVGVSVGLGLQGVSASASVSAGFQNSDSKSEATTNTNALVSAGGKVTIKSGKDTTIAGARVEAAEVVAEVGGDLTVESRQDTLRSRSSQAGASLSLSTSLGGASSTNQDGSINTGMFDDAGKTIGGAIENGGEGQQRTAGIGLSYGRGERDRAWTEEQTAIVGTEAVDLTVAGNTHLKGSVIEAKSGALSIDTATLTFEDIQDYDRSKNFSVSLNLSTSFGGPGEDADRQTRAAAGDVFEKSGFKLEGGYEKAVKEGVSRATVGEGEIGIRDTAGQAALEASGKTGKLAALNRDLDLAQEVTRDERESVKFYVSDTSIKRAIEAGEKITDVISKVLERLNEPAFAAALRDGEFGDLKDKANADKLLKQLRNCQRHATNWNPFHLLITPAYAGQGCVLETISGKQITVSDAKSCFVAIVSSVFYAAQSVHSEAFYRGLYNGAYKQGEEFVELIKDPSALASAITDLAGELWANPDGTLAKMATGVVDDLQTKSYEYLAALLREDYEKAGELLSGLAVDMAVKVLAPAAAAGLTIAKGSKILQQLTAVGQKLCFVAGTPVWTRDGFKAIEEIRVGDWVVSRDERTQQTVLKPVVRTFKRTSSQILRLTLESGGGKTESFGTTKEHPFHVPGRGFVQAGKLRPGDVISSGAVADVKPMVSLVSLAGEDSSGFVAVKSLMLEDRTETVYNFEVADTHTYFVGRTKAWVHNACDVPGFIARADGQILDISKIVVPGPTNSPYGKMDYLLGKVTGNIDSAGKGGYFGGLLGFNSGDDLAAAIQGHLKGNFGGAIINGSKLEVIAPITGPNGVTANVKAVWQVTPTGSVSFVTALPGPKL